MKHENGVSNMVGCLQVVKIYSFMKNIEVYKRASYIALLFVKTKNNCVQRRRTHINLAVACGLRPDFTLEHFWSYVRTAGKCLDFMRPLLQNVLHLMVKFWLRFLCLDFQRIQLNSYLSQQKIFLDSMANHCKNLLSNRVAIKQVDVRLHDEFVSLVVLFLKQARIVCVNCSLSRW